jgi:hypothetical protein
VAPVVSAHNASAGFNDSFVLQQDGLGHCSLSNPGRCVIDATRNYWVNGTLPAIGTVCQPDFNVFLNHTTAESYLMAANGELVKQGW